MNEQNCANCRYSKPIEWVHAPSGVVTCRRRPPVIVAEMLDVENDALTWGSWPHVGATQWCGEWKAQEE